MNFIGLLSVSTGYWPIHRRCGHKCAAYGYDRSCLVKFFTGMEREVMTLVMQAQT